MNLGKLLATGKSMISGKVTAKYRENKHVYLPKFTPTKNPFAQSPATAVTPELPVAPKAEATLVGVKTRPLPTMPPVKPEKVEKTAPAGWVSKISSVSVWRGWLAEVKDQQATVQAELSLEAVRVVHNDLSDTDVEVVPIKSRPVPSKTVREVAPVEQATWEPASEPLLKVH